MKKQRHPNALEEAKLLGRAERTAIRIRAAEVVRREPELSLARLRERFPHVDRAALSVLKRQK